MNHYALFLKLLKRKLPIQIIDHWFEASLTCVRWDSSLSHFVKLVSGVRQGGVLSPQFFALLINDVIDKLYIGCRMSVVFVPIFVSADDIVLLAPSVGSLLTLQALLETLLENLDMRINALKSACIRFGPTHDADCANLTMKNGEAIAWVSTCKGV